MGDARIESNNIACQNCAAWGPNASESPDLPDALHAGTNSLVDSVELPQIPARHLRHHVVEGGFEARRGAQGHTVPEGSIWSHLPNTI